MIDLSIHHLSHRKYFEKMNEVIQSAIDNPKELKQFASDIFYIFINNEVLEIVEIDEGPSKGMWIATEFNGKWHSDFAPTLENLKRILDISEE